MSIATSKSVAGTAAKKGVAGQSQPTSGRSRLTQVTGIQVLGTGSFVPDTVVRNEDLGRLGYDSDWIIQRTGIRERRHAAEGVVTSDMAYQAAVRCLASADVGADEVDLILLATMTPDYMMPTTACLVQQRLGCIAPAIELNAACTGFMYALVTGMQYVRSGCSRRVLVIGADLLSRSINPEDKKTYPLFGDGAGAVLLGPGDDQQGFLSVTLGSEGDRDRLLCQPAGGTQEPFSQAAINANRHFIQMDGRAVYKWAVRVVSDSCLDVLRHARLSVDDVDLALFHQANVRIIDAALENTGIRRDRVVVNLDRYGNTSAGSIPLVLDEACRSGRISAGDRVLFCGFGGGLSWGTGIFVW